MSTEPQLFKINSDSKESEKIKEVEFSDLGFKERQDIQEWVAANPEILGDDLLIIGKEFSGFDRTNERLDLLAIDADGTLVVIELKRDHSGTDAHWQAIKYASYFRQAKQDDIIRRLAEYIKQSEDDAVSILQQHISADDLGALNNDQRIILASHRFAPEVTSAALWLNEKVQGENLITCVQLTPYQDGDSLYVQTNTIIPLPGEEEYAIGVVESMHGESGDAPSSFATKLRTTINRNKNDEVSAFFKERVRNLVIDGLPLGIRPEKNSKFAIGNPYWRSYHFWYSRPPWGNWDTFYRVNLLPKREGEKSFWLAEVGVECIVNNTRKKFALSGDDIKELENVLAGMKILDDQQYVHDGKAFSLSVKHRSELLDDNLANTIVESLKPFIEEVTPALDDFENSRNEEEPAQ